MSALSWGGWTLDGKLLTQPRRAWLRASEALLMRELILEKGKYILPTDLHARTTRGGNLQTMRTKIATLRDAVGKNNIMLSRDYGYRLLPAYESHAAMRHPVEDLITSLTDALEAARRLKRTMDLDKEKEAR